MNIVIKMSITKKHQKVPWFYHGFRSFTIVNVSIFLQKSTVAVPLYSDGDTMIL